MLLYKAIPVHNNRIAKKGDHKEILAVFPIKPQVAKEMITITHHGNTICNKNAAMMITRNTMLLRFSYFKF